MIDNNLLSKVRSVCIDLRLAIEDHQANETLTGELAVDPETAKSLAWSLAKTARMLLEDDRLRSEDEDRAAVLLDEVEDILNGNQL